MQFEPFHKSIEKQLLEESKPGMLSSLLNSLKQVELNPLIVTAYDSISDPVLVVLISNSSILYANKAANKLFQFSSLKGQSLDDLIPDLPIVLKQSRHEMLKERMDGRRRDGSGFPLLVSVSHLAKEGVHSKKGHQDVVVLTLNLIQTKSQNTTVSRYKKEFEEVKVIGRGGFGIVLEAKNRLDGQYYAIKKVRLNCSPENLTLFTNSSAPASTFRKHSRHLSESDHRLLNEVKTFALLSNHPNVIRYYNAWIESIEDSEQNNIDSDTESETSAGLDSQHQSTLYIQMQLCPYQDLRKWIRTRNSIDIYLCMNIFHQITLGLAHIHSQGVIHRDVKPENIFVDHEHIFLGDFGLAKQIEESALYPSPRVSFLKPLVNSTDDGTFFYMAPEIKSSKVCTTKSDIFSLGIILFELLTQFDTDMERAIMLNKLRSSGKVPQYLLDQYPAQSNIILELISSDPEKRPTAQDILGSGVFFKDSRRVTISSFGGSGYESPLSAFSISMPRDQSDFNEKRAGLNALRNSRSAFSIETNDPLDFGQARERRATDEIIWMPWGLSNINHVEDHDLPDKMMTANNVGKYSSSYHPPCNIKPETDKLHSQSLDESDPKLRILALERDVACLEAKLKALTVHYPYMEEELKRSHSTSTEITLDISPVSISSEKDKKSLSIPIPIPSRQ